MNNQSHGAGERRRRLVSFGHLARSSNISRTKPLAAVGQEKPQRCCGLRGYGVNRFAAIYLSQNYPKAG
jgi:hypothetical protein